MSLLASSFAATGDSDDGRKALEQLIRGRWPNVADCLFGVVSAEEGSPCLPPCSVILFVEAGALRFCLCPANRRERGHGSISEPLKGLDGLEDDLSKNGVRWSSPRNKRSS